MKVVSELTFLQSEISYNERCNREHSATEFLLRSKTEGKKFNQKNFKILEGMTQVLNKEFNLIRGLM
jgi:hypothetical protein